MRTALAVSLAFLGASSPLGAQVAPTRYDSLFNQLMAVPASIGGAAKVSDVTITRDVATFTLHTGEVRLLGAIGGRVVAAVFAGQGTFAFAPPTKIEQEHLLRTLKSRTLERRFTRLFLLFTDSTAAELQRATGAGTASGPAVPELEDLVRKGLEYVSHRGRRYFDTNVLTAMLNGEQNEGFFAMVDGAPGGPYLFQVDPYEPEEVSLATGKAGDAMTQNRSELVSRFDWARDLAAGQVTSADRKERFGVSHYVIDATVAGNLGFRASATLTFDWWGEPRDWFPLYLFPDLKVDSARWESKDNATVVQGKDNPVLWVRRPDGTTGGAMPRLALYYHGNMFEYNRPWIDLKTSNDWYPSTGIGYGLPATATFDLTFHIPRRYKFASIGERTENQLTGDILTTRWITTQPTFHASFNIGEFESLEMADRRNFPVTVLINEVAHNMIPGAVQGRDGRIIVIPRQANMKEAVGEDVSLSLAFFNSVFGDPPGKQFSATEISGGHGQAFPGLIHFSWATFQGFLLQKGEDEAFRSHEVAHQWWGLGVAVKSYRDAWISEGFATFASWLYTEAVLGDTAAVGRMLKRSKEQVMTRRNGAGPIWLGTRLGSDTYPQDYSLTVYDKGAWVLRMLRALMFDPAAEDADAAFKRMMSDFYQQHRGLLASTADFLKTVEHHMGKPMGWFFDSWVYGTGIPTYEWSHLIEPAEEVGKLRLKVRVVQKQVPDDFAMLVPVRLEFSDGQSRTERLMVKGPTTEVSFELAAKPARVVFNPSDAVLAEVKQTKWR